MPTDEEIYGAAPEPLDYNKAWGEYKNGEKPLLDALMSNYTKPVQQITPEQAKKAKFGSAMTDTFTSLAEMFAHGQGARVRNRDGKSNVQTTNEKLKAMDDEYEAKMQNYGGVRANAELQDFNRKMEMDRYNAGAKRNYYLNIQAQKEKAAILKRQMDKDAATLQREIDRDAAKDKQFGRQMTETEKQNNERNAIDWYNATHKPVSSSESAYYGFSENGQKEFKVSVQKHGRDLQTQADKMGMITLKAEPSAVPALARQAMVSMTDEQKYAAGLSNRKIKMDGGEVVKEGDKPVYDYENTGTPEQYAQMQLQADYNKKHNYQPNPGEKQSTDGKWWKQSKTGGTVLTGTKDGVKTARTITPAQSKQSSSGNLY